MPLYTFRLPAAFSSTPVTVYNSADVQQTTGTTDANATFAATLPTGDYYAKVSYGYTSYRAAGEVDRGDLDNVSEAAFIPALQPGWNGTPAAANSSLVDMEHDSAQGYLFHLHSGAGMTGGSLIALGVGDGGATPASGMFVSQKAASSGPAVRWTNAVGTTGRMLHATHQSTSITSNNPFVYLETTNSTGVASPLVGLVANGSPGVGQKMFTVDTAALAGRAASMGTTVFQIYADSGDVVARGGAMRLNGATLDVVQADSGETYTIRSRMQVSVAADDVSHVYYRYSGSAGQWFANRIATNAGGGTTELAIQNGTGAAAVGGHTFVSAIRTKSVSGAAGLGFYGTAPIARPTATPAAAVDAATTQALVNDIRTKLLALGLIA